MVGLKERRISLDLDDDSTVKWEDAGRRYCLHIQRDDQAEDPREEMDLMACWHGRYKLGDKVEDKDPEEFWRRLVRERVTCGEIFAAAEAGKLNGICLAPNKEHPEDADVYETYYLRTVLGNTAPSERLEYEGISKDAVVGYIMDDLTVGHCMTLLRPYVEWLPLWLYDHSGITMACGERTRPYDDEWESMQVGWIIALKERVLSELCVGEDAWRERAVACMRSSVREYDQYSYPTLKTEFVAAEIAVSNEE